MRSTLARVNRESFAIGAVTLVGLVLRLYRLGHQSIWLDEGYQYYFAGAESLGGVVNRVLDPQISTHPPLSHLINHIFLGLGDTDFMLRLPSALFGAASLPICYLLAKRLTSGSTALIASAVLAVSPFHIWYSQEARMYSQLMFFALLSSLLLVVALEHSRRPMLWVGYAIAVAAGMYTHIFMAMTVLAHGLWLLIYRRRSLIPFITAGAGSLALFLPMVPFLFDSYQGPVFAQGPKSSAGFSVAILPYTIYTYAAGFSLGPSTRELKVDPGIGTLMENSAALLIVGVVFGSLLMVSLYSLYRTNPKVLVFCILSLAMPLLGSTAFSLIPSGIFHVRYTIAAHPFFCVMVGSATTFLFRMGRLWRVVPAVAVLGISSVSIHNLYTDSRYAKTDYRAGVQTWRRESQGAPLLINVKPPVIRYLLENETDRVLATTENLVPEANRRLLDGHSAVWILLARDWHGSSAAEIRRAFRVVDNRSLNGAELFVISGPPAAAADH